VKARIFTIGASGPTGGDDVLNGTPGKDTINGLGGDDTIHGKGGNDTLKGSSGNGWQKPVCARHRCRRAAAFLKPDRSNQFYLIR